MERISRLLLLIMTFIILATNCGGEKISGHSLFFEVHTKEGVKQVVVQPNDIVRAGIDGRGVEPSIGITVAPKYHELIEKLTKENIGQKMVIRTDTETVFSGTIMEDIRMGKLAFLCPSVQEAEAIFRKIGREPDYRLKLTPEELEAAKKAIEPYKSEWANKALEASANRDYPKAEEYAKKAIDEDPHEARYHKLLGLAYFQGGRKKLALDEALIGEKLSTKEDLKRSPGPYFDIAFLYAQLNEYEKAIEYLKKILSDNENNAHARLRLAEIYEKMGKCDLAIQVYSFLSNADDEPTREKALEGLRRLEEKPK